VSAPAPAKKVRDTGIIRREVTPSTLSKTTEGKTAPRTTIPPAPRTAPTTVVAPPGPPEPTASYWALQAISGINLNKAEELRAALEKQGYPNVVVKREGRYAAVRLGRFESKDSSEALQFKKNLSEMRYEGRTQFSGCYFVKVE
jgi:cell division septation protein DedD